jgi:hypothetical protein
MLYGGLNQQAIGTYPSTHAEVIMTIRKMLILLVATTLVPLAACSTTSDAQKDEETATAEQAQTESEGDDETKGRTKVGEAETAGDGEADGEDAESAEATGKETPAEAAERRKMKGMCPMNVEGTTRSIEKLDGAIAVNFTTTGDVEKLRKRVSKMAKMHNKHSEKHAKKHRKKAEHAKHGKKGKHAKKGKKGEHAKKGHGHHKKMKMMANTTAEAEEIDGGMRLKLSSDDADQLEKIHQKMQEHGGKEGCPMMHMKRAKAGSK